MGSDADIKELIEACRGLVEANYNLINTVQQVVERYGFKFDVRDKSTWWKHDNRSR